MKRGTIYELIIAVLFFSLGVLACSDSERLQPKGVEYIIVYVNQTFPNADSFIISDKTQITGLIDLINSRKREPIKFFASHSLQIQYEDTVRTVVVLNDLCKIDGISYRMKDNVSKYLHE